jgi:calcineurin-like phosphoesterase family protein
MLYFTADQHFGHNNIRHLCKRPYKTIDEMNKALIDNWNSVVTPDDTVYVLGDFAYKMANRLYQYVHQLHGHKHIIMGNHDRLPRVEYEQQFETVNNYLEIDYQDQHIVLFHYPILSWNKRARGSWMLYGHVHTAGQMRQLDGMKAWNVGVDANEYKPISFEELEVIMDEKGVQVSDHHIPV